ncbi:MAG: divergent polysaccharide deacetylase family protein [Pseudomonadota bacterium]
MTGRVIRDPSPLQTGLMHGIMSLAVCTGFFGLAGLGIHVTGDVRDAGPKEVLALFEPRPTARPLKTQIQDNSYDVFTSTPRQTTLASRPETEEISLISDPGSGDVPVPAPTRPVAPDAVRINGQLVPAGRSLSEVTAEIRLPRAPIPGLTERLNGRTLPMIASDGRRPDKAYARPTRNPEGRPTVSIIVGGLGINSGTTNAAIRDLPPEVTLSFVASAPNLPGLVRRARAAGHEVLIELPMEGFEPDGGKSPPNLLRAEALDANAARLTKLLSSTTGYFGVTNYKGNKFGIDLASVNPVIETLAKRGVAFIEDGSITDGQFEFAARSFGASYARSDLVIDADTDANAIEAKLFELETEARRSGAAMGTGFAFPLTVDTVKIWAASLEEKGLVLAPASSRMSIAQTPAALSVRSASSGGSQ